jgi:YggT family protein
LIRIYIIIIIIRAVISWIGDIPPNRFIYLLRKITDPVFYFVHRHVPFAVIGGIDISPILIILALYLVDSILLNAMVSQAAGGRL